MNTINNKKDINNQDLYQQFIELENKYTELSKQHLDLLEEYKENVIIQSMNDMKERYERLLKYSVTKTKYEMLSDKYVKLLKKCSGCTVILDHTTDLLYKVDKGHSVDIKNSLTKIEYDLSLVKDILEDSIKSYSN